MSLRSFLAHFGLLSRFSADDVAQAESDNLMREHALAVERTETQARRISQSSKQLRESIRRSSVAAFGELEVSMQRRRSSRVR